MLAPQHFQQWDVFHEALAIERRAISAPFPWGVHSMEIDTEVLARGDVRLLAFRGVLPTGVVIRIPEFDPPPPIESFKDAFDHRSDTIDVFVGLPFKRTGWPNYVRDGESGDSNDEVRYSVKSVMVADESTGREERSIERAEQNLRLLFSTGARENYESLPIARIARTASGDFRLVEEYVPPALSLRASPYLERLARSVLERLVARSSSLASEFGQAGLDARDITPANLRRFLHFAVINGTIPQLAHLLDRESTHPDTLYQLLAAVAGHLTTFNAGRFHPRDVPPYRHESLGTTFAQLEKMVVDLLEVGPGHRGYEVLPLKAGGGEGQMTAVLDRESLLGAESGLYLVVSSDRLGEQQVLVSSTRIILSSPDRLTQKLATNVPGVRLRHVAVPPPAIPRRADAVYFQLENRGPEWDAIRTAHALSLYVPGDIRTESQIELLAIEGKR